MFIFLIILIYYDSVIHKNSENQVAHYFIQYRMRRPAMLVRAVVWRRCEAGRPRFEWVAKLINQRQPAGAAAQHWRSVVPHSSVLQGRHWHMLNRNLETETRRFFSVVW